MIACWNSRVDGKSYTIDRSHVGSLIYVSMFISHRPLEFILLQLPHDERDDISNHRHLDCLLNHLLKKLRVTGPLWAKFTGDRWLPRPRTSNAEKASIWWRHHGMVIIFIICWVNSRSACEWFCFRTWWRQCVSLIKISMLVRNQL